MTQDTTIKNTDDLLTFLVKQSESRKDWFGFTQQRLTAVSLAHEIAKRHADKMSPKEIVEYAIELNEVIFHNIIKTR
jgi:hypothetical protein